MISESRCAELAEIHGTPLLILNRAELVRRFALLTELLPRVTIHYAVKALPDFHVVDCLNGHGARFEIATCGEIALLKQAGVSPQAVIHTHPIKRDEDIKAALRYGCTTFVVDNLTEIEKFARYRERVGILLRVRTETSDAAVDLSKKFGCEPADVAELVQRAVEQNVHVKGLSFHIGSQARDPSAHVTAIAEVYQALSACRGLNGAPLTTLDIGGGFPASRSGDATEELVEYCRPIRTALAQLPENIHIVAEPGRALVASAVSSVNSVIGVAWRKGKPWYYLDDGVYGAFSGRVFDHAEFVVSALGNTSTADLEEAVLAGPTCDSIDVITEHAQMPKLNIGDRVVSNMMGAYSLATATEFNSIPKPPVIVIDD